MSAYGEDGIARMLQILKEETVRAMRLIGAATLKDLTPAMVDARGLELHPAAMPHPPSPYAPASAAAEEEAANLRKQVQTLQARVKELEDENALLTKGAGASPVGGSQGKGKGGRVLVPLLGAIVMQTLKTIFAPTTAQALNRSAIFLFIFLIVHMLGNL